jgi:glutamate N-acetyltransferase/amino-acid N-acetyltransferase
VLATTAGPASAAATFTTNRVQAAPVRLSRANLAVSGGRVAAVISTSGCANAATGSAGERDQADLAAALAGALDVAPGLTLALSTGLIGSRLPVDAIRGALEGLVSAGLGTTDEALATLAEQLRTTDSRPKAASVAVSLPGPAGPAREVVVSGVAKGVGMIHPRMATMLAVVLTDATVEPAVLDGLLRPVVARTWNQLSVDGDTSTNDTVFLLASGAGGSGSVQAGTHEAAQLGRAIEAVARDLARQQAADGEGATTLITCQVSGALDDADARAVARAVVSSSLVKAAAHGRDPNWGRIAGAAGNARVADREVLVAAGLGPDAAAQRAGGPATVDPDRLRIAIAGQLVFDGTHGGPVAFNRAATRALMDGPEILIRLDLGLGGGTGEGFGCDLTEAYVIENSEYTT